MAQKHFAQVLARLSPRPAARSSAPRAALLEPIAARRRRIAALAG
jgi:hypothetical protein